MREAEHSFAGQQRSNIPMPHVRSIRGRSTKQTLGRGPSHRDDNFEMWHCPEDAEASSWKAHCQFIQFRFTLTYLPFFFLDIRRLTLDDVDDQHVFVSIKI